MKLYFSKGTCSLGVRITLNELGIKCDYEAVDLKTKQTAGGSNFLTINPKGSVPALQVDDGQILTENGAIQQYLAERYQATQLLPPPEDFKRYRVLEWLSFAGSDFHKSFAPLFNSKVPQKDKDEIFIPIVKNKLSFLDEHLAKNKYLAGENLTLPDNYLFAMLRWLPHFNMELKEWANVTRYYDEIERRVAVQQSLKEENN